MYPDDFDGPRRCTTGDEQLREIALEQYVATPRGRERQVAADELSTMVERCTVRNGLIVRKDTGEIEDFKGDD